MPCGHPGPPMMAYGKFALCLRCYSDAWDAGRASILAESQERETRLKYEIRETRLKFGTLLADLAKDAAERKDYQTSDRIRAEIRLMGGEIRGRSFVDVKFSFPIDG